MVRTVFLSLSLLLAAPAWSQILPTYGEERAGLSAFTFLKRAIDPASTAVGGASLAMTEHSYGQLSNPALVSGGHQTGAFLATRSLGGGITHNFAAVSKERSSGQHITVSLNNLNSGDVLERTEWLPEGTGRVFQSNLTALAVGISQPFSEYFHAGVQLKYGYEQLGNYYAHNAFIDLGFLYKLDIADLQFAAALTNFGPSTPISNAPDFTDNALAATPQMFSMGLQWTAWESGDHKITPSFQLTHPTDNAEFYMAGVKYQWRTKFWTGAGYQVGSQKSLPWMGLGMETQVGGWPVEWGVGMGPTPYNRYEGTVGLKITPLSWK